MAAENRYSTQIVLQGYSGKLMMLDNGNRNGEPIEKGKSRPPPTQVRLHLHSAVPSFGTAANYNRQPGEMCSTSALVTRHRLSDSFAAFSTRSS